MSRALVIAGLVVLTAAAHGRTVGFGFVWDDHELIRLNPLVRGERPAADVWTTHLFEGTRPGATGLYRPLAVGSFRATWALWQAPWAFHLTNVLLHVFCVLLLFWLARCLGAGLAAAALGAAAFAVFPPNVEAVAWISGRPDLLLCLGLGLALAATLGGRRWPAWRQAALLGGGLAVALLSKEPAMPAAAALALWLALQREDAGRHRALALMAAALVAGLLLVRGMALDTFLPFVLQPGDQSVGGRLARLGVQLQLLAGFDLSAMVRVPQAGAGRAVAQVVGLAVPLMGLGGAALLWRRGHRAPALLLALALVMVLPAATARVPALRYLYTPAFLLCALGALGLQRLATRWRPRPVLGLAAVLVLCYLAMGQLWLGAWRSDPLLFATEAAHQPHNPDAQFLHGEQLLLRGRAKEAAATFRAALALSPGHRPAWMGLALALLRSNRYGAAEEVIRTTLRGRPRRAKQFTLLGHALAGQGKHRQAMAAYTEALRRNPRSRAARAGVAQSSKAMGGGGQGSAPAEGPKEPSTEAPDLRRRRTGKKR